MFKLLACVLVVQCWVLSARANDLQPETEAKAEPLSSSPSLLDEVVSPWTEAKPLVLGGAALTLGTYILKNQNRNNSLDSTVAAQKPLGESSRGFDYEGQLIPNALYAVGYGTYGLIDSNNALAYRKAWTMVKASAYAGTLTTLLKYSVRETRPDQTSHNSFPSGHSTTIGAFAGVVLAQEPLSYGAAAGLLAGLVGFSRVNDNRHYFHDVTAGLTIGLAYGLGVARTQGTHLQMVKESSRFKKGQAEVQANQTSPYCRSDCLNFKQSKDASIQQRAIASEARDSRAAYRSEPDYETLKNRPFYERIFVRPMIGNTIAGFAITAWF